MHWKREEDWAGPRLVVHSQNTYASKIAYPARRILNRPPLSLVASAHGTLKALVDLETETLF